MTGDHSRPPAEPDGTRDPTASFDRRRYLQTLAALGALGVGGSAAASAQQRDGETVEITDEDSEDWEAAADDRIRQYRTGDLTVTVRDADGDAKDGVDVAVEMAEHAFGFGTAVNAGTLIDETEEGDEYREYIPELFNEAVMENHHKWRFWEDSQDLADAATEWILDRELDLRGHVALWANVGAWAVPPDVVSAMGVEWEDNGVTDPELDPEYVEERTTEHVEEIISHYGDDVVDWEVHNETIHEPGFIEAINGVVPTDEDDELDFPAVEAPILAEWHHIARDAAPEGTPLTVNDYNTLAGPHEYARDAYVQQIEFLLDQGVDLGGIGMQSHFNEGERLTPAQILEGLNLYAGYGTDLRITEFDTADDAWTDEEKADILYETLKTAYSHPAMADFLMWGFWDGRHWQGDAPLFYGPDDEEHDNWEPKPAYDAYTDLVFDQWWTDETGTTEDGSFTATAYVGDHDVTVSFDDYDVETDLSIEDPEDHTLSVVVVDLDVKGNANGKGATPVGVSGGDAFDPSALDVGTLRLGAPAEVNDGGGSELRNGKGCEKGKRTGNSKCTLQFEAIGETCGVAMLRGRTDDGTLVVGFDRP